MANKLLRIQARRKGKRIRLQAKNVRVTQNLGNGFRRLRFNPVVIGPNSFLTIIIPAGPGRAVISGGWTISNFTSAWPTDSFPLSDSEWAIIIENPTNVARSIVTFLITKAL